MYFQRRKLPWGPRLDGSREALRLGAFNGKKIQYGAQGTQPPTPGPPEEEGQKHHAQSNRRTGQERSTGD